MFTFFVKLPTELKDRIWHYVTKEERLIELREPRRSLRPSQRGLLFDHQVPVPSILQVCRDSRAKGKQDYTKCKTRGGLSLVCYLGNIDYLRPEERILWVNFQRDVFVCD
ncbi:hypothetical protein L207DRAFT_86788 [Hyaloscypha variabilis F]|uniref:2EXR domain-containing protein n=1 Tax=Hyaloscypha variabilis (strain UAMH 11265 / GT02V1 / F) TaxID=1149755 RepID=A0A2J6RDR0_HYAVF|nr:hypothetical protein L207DRAFT_86788 [Hyaloscypha variabilis F]